ncbi:hypothetical protein KR018_006781, partial [Drosophila ironensis]
FPILVVLLFAASGAGQFCEDLFQKMAQTHPGANFLVSPLAIELTLAMLRTGSEGPSAEQLNKALRLPVPLEEILQKYSNITANIANMGKPSMRLDLGSRIFASDRYELKPGFNEIAQLAFRIEVDQINMGNGKKAAGVIDKWVHTHTNGMIRNIMGKDYPKIDTHMIVVNGIYFKAQWQYRFSPKKGSFWVTKKKSVPVEMMTVRGAFMAGVFPALRAKVIALPYANSSLSMLIFLPDEIDGLATLEESIAGLTVPQHFLDVTLELPKLKLLYRREMRQTLSQMGAQSMFSPTLADLSLIFANKAKGGVDGFIHKGVIEVDHSAADTVPSPRMRTIIPIIDYHNYSHLTLSFAVPNGKDKFLYRFTVDLPFAFTIRDRTTIYFQGQVNNPKL